MSTTPYLTAAQAFRRIAEKLLTEKRIAAGICYEAFMLRCDDRISYDTKGQMVRLINLLKEDIRADYIWEIGRLSARRALLCYLLAEMIDAHPHGIEGVCAELPPNEYDDEDLD